MLPASLGWRDDLADTRLAIALLTLLMNSMAAAAAAAAA
jgi:hypothetical protein